MEIDMANITSIKVRRAVMESYNNCCAACGCTDSEALQIDHVVPQSHGGSDDFDNLQVLCYVCNSLIKGKVQTPKLKPAKPSGSVNKWKRARRDFRAYISGLRASQ
jgi:5-methylcytosine-specific restriction endonuclease McrA